MTKTTIIGPDIVRKRNITKRQFIEALELNGYPQGFFHAVETDDADKNIVNACAYGQALLNLGAWSVDLGLTIFDITDLNDQKKKTPKQIARYLTKLWKKELDDEVSIIEHDWSKYENYAGVKVK